MKYLIAFILLLSSCRTDKKLEVIVQQGSGWKGTTHYIHCDSAIQTNKNYAVIWLDGDSLNIYGDAILIQPN
jgi:hypothetical protein